ncbi:unnamed protein product [Arctogadus glacialis]
MEARSQHSISAFLYFHNGSSLLPFALHTSELVSPSSQCRVRKETPVHWCLLPHPALSSCRQMQPRVEARAAASITFPLVLMMAGSGRQGGLIEKSFESPQVKEPSVHQQAADSRDAPAPPWPLWLQGLVTAGTPQPARTPLASGFDHCRDARRSGSFRPLFSGHVLRLKMLRIRKHLFLMDRRLDPGFITGHNAVFVDTGLYLLFTYMWIW